jgi:cardiolipin synthase
MNIPNSLTLLRIFLVPLFLIAVIYGELAVAFGIFLFASATDLLDGFLARRLGQETRLGLYLDPVADKLLIIIAYLVLGFFGLLPSWLAVVVFFKDLFMVIGVVLLAVLGAPLTVFPTIWGKITTFFQLATLALVLYKGVFHQGEHLLMPLFGLTGLLTAFSGGHYIIKRMGLLSCDSLSLYRFEDRD